MSGAYFHGRFECVAMTFSFYVVFNNILRRFRACSG